VIGSMISFLNFSHPFNSKFEAFYFPPLRGP